jgi:hypothetical protein
VKHSHLVAGLLAAAMVWAGSAQARIGGTQPAFDQTILVKKLGYRATGTQDIVSGRYKGFKACQYVSPDVRSFIDLVVSPKGGIAQEAMLMPVQPNAMDAARFLEFMRDATNNSVNMNDIFKFIHDSVQIAKEYRKQFGGYAVTVFRYPRIMAAAAPGQAGDQGTLMDLQVAAAGPSRAKAK